MMIDYDLVVIGASPEGIYAAQKAVSLKARVALVEQPSQTFLASTEAIYSRTLNHYAHLWQQWMDATGSTPSFSTFSRQLLEQVQPWGNEVINSFNPENSLLNLAVLGVDVIRGNGEFCRLPKLSFLVNQRRLRSRSYLLATGSHPSLLHIDGLEKTGYLTSADLWQQNQLVMLPQHLVLVGGNPLAIELAQSLRRFGKEVTLIVETQNLLPTEDPDISYLIQAQLEAEGVQILTQSPLTQVKKIEDKKWIQAGNRAIETDEIILVTQRQPNLAGLNLEGVGIVMDKHSLKVNDKLQTTNPKIYV